MWDTEQASKTHKGQETSQNDKSEEFSPKKKKFQEERQPEKCSKETETIYLIKVLEEHSEDS